MSLSLLQSDNILSAFDDSNTHAASSDVIVLVRELKFFNL